MRKFIILALLMLVSISISAVTIENKNGYEKLRTELLSINKTEQLTEWDMLILAICWQESRFIKPTNENFHGYMQISRIYVKEVNRLASTNYTYDDAHSFRKSVDMHNLMNKHKNPNKDVMKALRIHNPRTAYHNSVLTKLKVIKEYESNRNNGG